MPLEHTTFEQRKYIFSFDNKEPLLQCVPPLPVATCLLLLPPVSFAGATSVVFLLQQPFGVAPPVPCSAFLQPQPLLGVHFAVEDVPSPPPQQAAANDVAS